MTSPRKRYRSRMPEYRSWYSMKQRCNYRHETHYEYYGGRGITVCERWAIFENFLEDMGKRPAGTSLDRINNEGNYEPNNCRWATQAQQLRNTRRNFLIEFRGI